MTPTLASSISVKEMRPKSPRFAHATLYNTLRHNGNGCLFFILIVVICRFSCAWKTRAVLWIVRAFSLLSIIPVGSVSSV